jgi:group I intron endonuclease
MIGIYKITSPNGKVYIGQSVDMESREKQYSRLDNCKQQIRLYRSLVKYGYSNHIFEVVEECRIEELNTRERYWQDFYNVLEEGLNLRLTETQDRSGKLSKETIEKMTITRINYNKTPEGKESRKRAMLHTDQAARVAKIDHRLRHERVNYKQRKLNTDYITRTANTDYKARTANTDWVEFAKKHYKPLLQFDKDEKLIREWDSGIEAGRTLGIHKNCISACLRGKQRTAGGFIWKYKNS